MAWPNAPGPALMDGEAVGTIDKIKYALGNLLVYGPLRNNLGFSRVRVALHSGRGHWPRPVHLLPLHRHQPQAAVRLHRNRRVCVPAARQPGRADTVGVPIRGVQIKVADNGEIMVKSAGLLKEYYKNPAATAEVLTADGWYHTSDAGFLTPRPPQDHRPRQGRGPHPGRGQ